MFKSGFHDSIKLSALTPKRYLTNEYKAPLCLFASDGEVMHVYNNTNDPNTDLYENPCEHYSDYDSEDEYSYDISELVYVDYPAYFEAIVWAEYETKGNAPTAFAAASDNSIVKIIFKDRDYDTFWQTIPGDSSIVVLKSPPFHQRAFCNHTSRENVHNRLDRRRARPVSRNRFDPFPGTFYVDIADCR
jgi:hypothetical protein